MLQIQETETKQNQQQKEKHLITLFHFYSITLKEK